MVDADRINARPIAGRQLIFSDLRAILTEPPSESFPHFARSKKIQEKTIWAIWPLLEPEAANWPGEISARVKQGDFKLTNEPAEFPFPQAIKQCYVRVRPPSDSSYGLVGPLEFVSVCWYSPLAGSLSEECKRRAFFRG